MVLLLILSVVSFAAAASIYLLYFLLVLRTSKKGEFFALLNTIVKAPFKREDLPEVTILVPAYNEEETIHAKIRNISESDYPKDKLKVVVLDDDSTDATRGVAQRAFEAFGVKGEVLSGETRRGVNALYNIGFEQADTEFILTTDADALMLPDTLSSSVKIMLSLEDVGGVAAKMAPIHDKTTASTRIADVYTDAYYLMLEAESAVFSTFPGGSSCMLVRRAAFSPMPSGYGSSDGNISLTVTRKGFKFIVAPCVPFFEPMSQRLGEMRRQKIRRAARLVQSAVLNRDIFLSRAYGEFGRTIFPLRLLMMTIVPPLILFSILFFFAFVFSVSVVAASVLLAAVVVTLLLGAQLEIKALQLAVSFLVHQFYLFAGVLLSFKKMNVWSHIDRAQAR